MERSRLVRMHIQNIGCIGNEGLTVELDNIVCLVGANNAGKTTVLRAYELAILQERLNIEDFNHNSDGKPAIVELWVHIPENAANVDEKWKEKTDNGLLLVRSKWEWPIEGGKPTRYTWDPIEKEYSEDGKAAGLDNVFNSRLPKPFRIGSLDNPQEEHKKLLTLVLEPIINKYKEIMNDKNSELSSKIRELTELACQPISDMNEDINKIQNEITKSYSKIFSNSGINLNIGISDIGFDPEKLLLSGSRIDITESNSSSVRWNQQGTGSQRALFWSILQVRSVLNQISDVRKELQKLKTKKSLSAKDQDKIAALENKLSQNTSDETFLPGYMLLIDEPETALHPSAVRAAKEYLYGLANEAGWQVMLSTHHPAFVDPLKDHTTIVRLHRKRQHNTPNIYKSDSAGFSDIELENLKALLAFDSNVSEIFFGDKVILVEGDTEFAAFTEVMNIQKDAYPIEQQPLILRARGKATIAILAKILTQFKINFSVLHDIDSPRTEKGDRVNPAYSINKNIKQAVETAREKGLSISYRCSCPNFEEHHKMVLPSKDKPFASWKAIRENKSIQNSVEAILRDLISDHTTDLGILEQDGTNYEAILKNWIQENNKSEELRYKFEP